jgi:hypothetical protein
LLHAHVACDVPNRAAILILPPPPRACSRMARVLLLQQIGDFVVKLSGERYAVI